MRNHKLVLGFINLALCIIFSLCLFGHLEAFPQISLYDEAPYMVGSRVTPSPPEDVYISGNYPDDCYDYYYDVCDYVYDNSYDICEGCYADCYVNYARYYLDCDEVCYEVCSEVWDEE